MIDFRYHIVSLISVFLALAVGIALGAGPLEETIGDTLTGQVEVLREEKDALRAELTDAQSSLDRQTVFLEDASTQLLDGTLTDRRVAVVVLGQVDEAARQGVEERLVAAGATVTALVQVDDAWTDPAGQDLREELAGDLGDRVGQAPDDDTVDGPHARLAAALARGLTDPAPDAPGRLSDDAAALLELLSTGDSALVALLEPVTAPADAVVVLAADHPQPSEDGAAEPTAAEDDPLAEAVAAHLAIVTAAEERADGVLVAGGVAAPGDLVSTILADGDLASEISTVTGFRGVTGQLSIALGLNVDIAGRVGHYGFGDGLTAAPEPVALAPADRSAGNATESPADPAPEG